MYLRLKRVPLAFALLFATSAAFSQTAPNPNEPQRYASSIYLKAHPDKQAALIDFYKTGAGAKTARARMKADPNMFSWSLRQVMYPGENGAAANFVIVTGSRGAPATPDPARRDEIYRAASGMTYAQYMQTARGMSEQVGSSLAHVHHLTDGFAFAEGDIVVSTRLKTAAGKTQAHSNLVRDVQFPLIAERVKSGGRMKGWAWGHLTFPSGDSLPWNATATSVYKSLEDALGATGPGSGTGAATAERFGKMFPTRSYVAYMDDLRELAHVVRTDVHRVVVSIQP